MPSGIGKRREEQKRIYIKGDKARGNKRKRRGRYEERREREIKKDKRKGRKERNIKRAI